MRRGLTASTHTQRSCLSREERNVVIWRKGRFALPMGLGRSKSWLRRTARFAFCRPGGTARASFCLPPTPPLTPRGAFQRARRARAPVGNAVRTHRGRPDRAICRTRCVRSFSDGAASTRAGWPNHVFSHAGCARYLALSHSKIPRRVAPPYFLTHRMRRVLALSHCKNPRRVVPPYFLTHRMRRVLGFLQKCKNIKLLLHF